jgi:polyhydroxybutyrate depolymerase
MDFWRARNGCTEQAAKILPHRDPSDLTRIRLIEWSGCENGVSLRLYRVNGGGHQVPSFSPNSEQSVGRFGRRNRDIETADEIWSFFKNVSR